MPKESPSRGSRAVPLDNYSIPGWILLVFVGGSSLIGSIAVFARIRGLYCANSRPPFSGDNAIAIGFAHLSEPPPPPSGLRKDIPVKLEAAILAALAKNPVERPASAKAFHDAAFG